MKMMKTKLTKNISQNGFSLIELLISMVIVSIILGILSSIIWGVNKSYAVHRPRMESVSDANAALDIMARLIRMAGNNPNAIAGLQGIDPGTAVSGQYNTIRIRSDWHGNTTSGPPDGDTNDSFEDITFTVVSGQLLKQENPADTAPVEFLDNVDSIRFTYFDTNNTPITDPVANNSAIARVNIEIDTQTPDSTAVTFKTSVYLRGK
jgi:prepilin-type N-terminal cleavage/methylation domain-containing protein